MCITVIGLANGGERVFAVAFKLDQLILLEIADPIDLMNVYGHFDKLLQLWHLFPDCKKDTSSFEFQSTGSGQSLFACTTQTVSLGAATNGSDSIDFRFKSSNLIALSFCLFFIDESSLSKCLRSSRYLFSFP